MRVLIVAPSDVRQVTGGLELHVRDLAAALEERGIETLVACPARGFARSSRTLLLPASFALLPAAYRRGAPLHPPWADPVFALALARLVRRWQPEVVHSHGNAFYSVRLALPTGGPGWLHTLHDYGLLCPKATLWHMPDGQVCSTALAPGCIPCYVAEAGTTPAAIGRGITLTAGSAARHLGRRLPDRFVAVSRYVKAAHERHLAESRGRTEVVYNWPTTESDGPVAPLPPLPERFALFVGAASPHKGFPFLLRLWREIDLDLPLVAFVTGSRVEIERILASAESRVYMHVNVDHRVVLLAWRKALMGLVPSLWPETFCLVALEAMTAGCPVIASSLGGLPEVVGDAGLLLPPGDMTAWREEVLRLASDDALRAALGEQGRERARELFSRERGVTALVRLYREVAGRSMP